MSAIHDHDFIWKDTYPGVWTTVVSLFGTTLVAYAIEVRKDDGRWTPVETEEAEDHFRRFNEASNYQSVTDEPGILGDMRCYFYVV